MPQPLVDPMPPLRESRLTAPDEAHEASYFAASARISSFSSVPSMFSICSHWAGESSGRKKRRNKASAGMERMEYRKLGSSGVKVSPLCLGTMMFGGATDEATAQRIIAKA